MKTVQILLILLLTIIIVLLFQKKIVKPQIIKYVEKQHPSYPFVQYDIREVLPPSRRTYMRYPYYFHRNGVLIR